MTEADSRQPFPTERDVGDALHATARAAVSAVPVLGTSDLISLVIQPPLERRRTTWLNDLAARLSDLEQKVEGFSLASLKDSPDFITAVTTASQIAIRNHSEEKLAALKNAVVNVALEKELENELYQVFLSLVDALTPLHLRILVVCRDAAALRKEVGGSFVDMRTIIEQAIPGLPQDVLRQVARDLYNRDLIQNDRLHVAMSVESMARKLTTDFGDRLLRFISEDDPAQ